MKIMKLKNLKYLFLSMTLIVFNSCDEDDDSIPYAEQFVEVTSGSANFDNFVSIGASIYYLRNDKKELVTIDKSKSAKLKIFFKLTEIEKIQKINQIDGKTYPEEEFTENIQLLKGFNNRLNEKILSINELFKLEKE